MHSAPRRNVIITTISHTFVSNVHFSMYKYKFLIKYISFYQVWPPNSWDIMDMVHLLTWMWILVWPLFSILVMLREPWWPLTAAVNWVTFLKTSAFLRNLPSKLKSGQTVIYSELLSIMYISGIRWSNLMG